MLYFKSASPPKGSNTKQLRALAAFRRSVEAKGVLYWTFPDDQHFASLVRLHLSRQLQEWHRRAHVGEVLAIEPKPSTQWAREAAATEIKDRLEQVGNQLIPVLQAFHDGLTALGNACSTYTRQLRQVGASQRTVIEIRRRTIFGLSRNLRELTQVCLATVNLFRPLFVEFMEELSQGTALLVDNPIGLRIWRMTIGVAARSLEESIGRAIFMLEDLIETVSSARSADRTLMRPSEAASQSLRMVKSEFEYAKRLVNEATEQYEGASS